MAAGDIFQFTNVYQVNDQPCACVFYQETIDDTGSTDEMADAEEGFFDIGLISLFPMLSHDLVTECVLGRQVFPKTSPLRVFQESRAGGAVFASLPANVAYNFRHYSDDGDKNKRGRWFQSGVPELWTNDGRIEQGIQTKFDTWRDVIVDEYVISGRTYRLKHYSKKLNQYFDVDEVLINPITTKVRNRTPQLCSIL